MDLLEVLSDDIDVFVFGEATDEFVHRMFKSDPNSFVVNDWCGITQITKILSTDHLFFHFNFYIVTETLFPEYVEILKKDIYLGIVTYLLDDAISFEKCSELYDMYVQDAVVSLKNIPGKIGFCYNSVVSAELGLLSLYCQSESHQIIQAGIKAAICSERKAGVFMKENRDGVLKNVKFITAAEESPYVEEKQGIYVWMFENYVKKNKKLNIHQSLIDELKASFKKNNENSCVLY
jgi:hypothetical protein